MEYLNESLKLFVINSTHYIFFMLQELLLGDATKAKNKFGWTPKVTFLELVKDMMESDIELMKKNPMA